jgi:hypothetical protein
MRGLVLTSVTAVLAAAVWLPGCAGPGAAQASGPRLEAPASASHEPTGRCRVHGRVDRVGAQAWVGVFGPQGRLAGRWIEERGFPFEFPDLPAGVPLVTVTWSPMAASPGALEVLRAAGTGRYTEAFRSVAAKIGRTGADGESIEQVLKVEFIDKPVVRVILRGLDRSVPPPVHTIVKVGLHVNETDLGVGHGCVTREFGEHEEGPLPEGPIELPIECDCGLELGWEVRVAGYRPVKRRVPLPPNPGPIELIIPLEKRACGTHGTVVDGRTGAPIAGAFVIPSPVELPEDNGGSIPGLGGDDDEFEVPSDWDDWLGGQPLGADGRFSVTDRLFEQRIIAVVPGVGCSAWTDLRGASAPLRLEIVPGNVVEGVVRDAATGRPAAGVRVVLEHHVAPTGEDRGIPGMEGLQGDPPPFPKTRTGVGVASITDTQGRYRFAGVPAEWYVRPIVLNDPRATPERAVPAVEYEGEYDEGGNFLPADVAAWLARRESAGELIRFADAGMTARRDLRAAVVPGRWVRLLFAQPKGDEPLFAIDVEQTNRVTRGATAQDADGSTEYDAGTATIVRTVELKDGRATISVRRMATVFWDRFNGAEDAKRETRLYLPAGHNRIVLSASGYRPVELAEEVPAEGAAAIDRKILLKQR